MKTLFKVFLFLLFPAVALANDGSGAKFTKQKTIAKAYLVNPDAGIDIENTYGHLYVTTWDEDKVQLDITIKVSGDKEDWVDARLASIDVDITALKSLVSARTKIGNVKGSGKNSSIQINYTIKIPNKGLVKLENKYGDITTSDLFGPTSIRCKYGRVTLGKLNSGSNNLNVEYANPVSIAYANTAKIDANYSKLSITDFGKLALNSNYTDVAITSGDALQYDCNYGKISLGKITNLNGNGNYLTISLGEVGGNLAVNTNYSSLKVKNLPASAGNVALDCGYTTVEIGYNPAYSFDFDINVRYASLVYEDLQVNSRKEANNSKSIRGFYKKSGGNKINISSNYGSVALTRN